MTHYDPDLADASGTDRFVHADGTEDRGAIRRAERFVFTWWGGVTRHDDEADQ